MYSTLQYKLHNGKKKTLFYKGNTDYWWPSLSPPQRL